MKRASDDSSYPRLLKQWSKSTPAERSQLLLARARWRKQHLSPRYKAFAARVRNLRKALGLTQVQFARQMGVYVRSIARWEGAEGHLPDRLHLKRLEELERLNSALVEQGRRGDFK